MLVNVGPESFIERVDGKYVDKVKDEFKNDKKDDIF